MYNSILILTVIYFVFICYVYFRYNMDVSDNSEYDKMYREKLDISASEAAYLENKNCNSLNIILADILTLNEKGYIKIELLEEGEKRDYKFIKQDNQDNSKLKSHEMSSYRLFFDNKTEVILSEFIYDIKTNYTKQSELELKSVSIKNDIEYELINQNIIDEKAEKKLLKYNNLSIRLILIFIFVLITTLIIWNKEYIKFSIIGFLFSCLLYRSTILKEDKLTKFGVETKKKAKGFKKYLREYVITEDKPLYMINILEYNYIMAVAFGFAKLGENEFIHNTYKEIQAKKIIGSLIDLFIIISIIAFEFILIKGVI